MGLPQKRCFKANDQNTAYVEWRCQLLAMAHINYEGHSLLHYISLFEHSAYFSRIMSPVQ